MAEVAERITIKGNKDGITVIFTEQCEWSELVSELEQKFLANGEFFSGSNLIVNFGTRALQEFELNELKTVIDNQNITLKGVLSDSPITKLLVQKEDLPLLSTGSIIHSKTGWQHPVRQGKLERPTSKNLRKNITGDLQKLPIGHQPALYLKRTIRSGQKINVSGTVVVLGDVNPGAEIVAGGDIVIFGALRGIAHAGASGNENSVVVALQLQPTQLRISQYIARAPEEPVNGKRSVRSEHSLDPGYGSRNANGWLPEIARVRSGAIYIDLYQHNNN